jgi:hypothetical protein
VVSLTFADIVGASEEVIASVKGYVARTLSPVKERVQALEQRIAAMEKSYLRYGGIWRKGAPHRLNDVVTHDGKLWICTSDGSEERPGSGAGWRMLHKD